MASRGHAHGKYKARVPWPKRRLDSKFIFNPFGHQSAATKEFKLTTTLCPYPTCYRLYVALATLTEPHQLTATLNCVTSVARALVRPDESYPAGRHHVLPLLQLVLPGIDPNDFRKALVSVYYTKGLQAQVPRDNFRFYFNIQIVKFFCTQ